MFALGLQQQMETEAFHDQRILLASRLPRLKYDSS